MGRQKKTIPGLCNHRQRGFSYVTDPRTGKQIVMGPSGSIEAATRYADWVREFSQEVHATPVILNAQAPRSIGELLGRWLEYCGNTYRRKDGRHTGEVGICVRAAGLLAGIADQQISFLNRSHLLQIRDGLVAKGDSRQTIKHYISRIVRAYRWGGEREWVSADQIARLSQLPAMRMDQGRPSKIVRGIPFRHLVRLYRALPDHWKPVFVWHLFTGQRVETALGVAVEDLDRTVTPWRYTPRQHKLLAKGLPMTILVGPKARQALGPLIAVKEKGLLFPGRTKVGNMIRRGPREYAGYHIAMAKACKVAGLPHYTPRQIRHTAAEWLVYQGVSESIVGAVLGHSGTGQESSLRSGSGSITSRYAAIQRKQVEETVQKWG